MSHIKPSSSLKEAQDEGVASKSGKIEWDDSLSRGVEQERYLILASE